MIKSSIWLLVLFYSYLNSELVLPVCLSANVCFYDFSSRVFLLGPSHHYYTPKCALSRATVYKTPVGDLQIDLEGTVSFVLFCFSLIFFGILCLFSSLGVPMLEALIFKIL